MPHDDQAFLRHWMQAQHAVAAWLMARGVPRQDADDVLQDVALAAHKAFARFDGSRPFVAWVLGIARHKMVDYWRDTPNHLWSLLDDEARDNIDRASIDLVEECSERTWAMQRCVGKLNGKARDLVERHYWKGHSLANIADACALTVANVKTRLHRIRGGLKQCVEQSLRQRESL